MLARKIYPNLNLILQGFIYKDDKPDRLMFGGSFLETPLYACMNQFISATEEIELYCRSAITSDLAKIHIIIIARQKDSDIR